MNKLPGRRVLWWVGLVLVVGWSSNLKFKVLDTMALADYQQAKLCLERGELDESFRLFSSFIDDPNSVVHSEELTDSYNARGHIRYLWVDFDDAIKDYTAAIKRDPCLVVAHYNRGQVHYRLGEGN